MSSTVKHPAKFSEVLLPYLAQALLGYRRVLDPMAGVGTLRKIRPDAVMVEIEREWAEQAPGASGIAIVGDAANMDFFQDGEFDAVCTSPCYGNRMADNFEARDGSKRNTYRHALNRELHPGNTGQFNWTRRDRLYQITHQKIWCEVWRVLRPGGRFVLNISDHIRKGQVAPVTRFHHLLLVRMGFGLVEHIRVKTPRNGFGQNGKLRVDYESILIYHKPLEPIWRLQEPFAVSNRSPRRPAKSRSKA